MEASINGKVSLDSGIPDSLRDAINKLIDEKVEEKMKVYEAKFQEQLQKLT